MASEPSNGSFFFFIFNFCCRKAAATAVRSENVIYLHLFVEKSVSPSLRTPHSEFPTVVSLRYFFSVEKRQSVRRLRSQATLKSQLQKTLNKSVVFNKKKLNEINNGFIDHFLFSFLEVPSFELSSQIAKTRESSQLLLSVPSLHC